MSITSDIQQLEPGGLVELFEVDCTAIGGDMLRFHGHLQSTSIWWQGNEYKPWPIQASGFKRTTDSQQPTPTLTVGDINGTISALCVYLADLVGATVRRRRTLVKYLDAVNFPRNNLLLWSEAFEKSPWEWMDCTATKATSVDPFGNHEARRISRVAVGNDYLVQVVPGVQSTAGFNGSIFLRADQTQEVGPIALRLRDSGDNEYGFQVVYPVADAWNRYDASGVFPVGSSGVKFIIDPINDSGAAGDSFLAFGAQLVTGLALQPYAYVDGQTGYNPTADPTEGMPSEVWRIEQKSNEQPGVQVEFTLASPLDFGGQQLPARQIASICQWRYRDANCGYTGTAYFDAKDQPVSDPALDRCSMKISGCECRFGINNPLSIGGYLSDTMS